MFADFLVIVSLALVWLLPVFLGQLRAMWPCSRHLKHLPSLANCARSSGVNFLKLDGVVASTSIGTMLGFELLWAGAQGWFWVVL